jgi:hypothetical protein
MDDSSTFDDSQDFQTTDDTVVEPDSDIPADGQTDIQDGTQGAQTVPFDRFSEVNERLRITEENNRKLIELLGRNPAQAQAPKEPEIDLVDQIVGDDMFVTKDQMREILKVQSQRTEQVLGQTTQSSRALMLNQTEEVFRQQTPDYDTVISQIPPKVIHSLMGVYTDPRELVQAAYNVGKGFIPQKPSAAQVVKQAGQQTQVQPKAVVANEIKGGGTGTKTVDQYLDEKFNSW